MARMKFKKAPIISLVIDLLLFLAAAIPLLLVHMLVDPFKRGFFCNDQSIQHPYREDTVPMYICAAFGVAITLGSFLIIEFSISLGCHLTKDTRLIHVLWSIAKLVIVFSFGIGVALILTETAKLCIGRLRPNFLDVCKPDWTNVNCSLGYVEHFTCLNQELPEKVIQDSRKSFPSGHSSFVAFTVAFMGYYYQQRLNLEYSVFLKVFMQLVVAVIGLFVMCSRVSDYKHHWSDVIAGAVLGAFAGLWTIICLKQHLNLNLRTFHPRPIATPTLDTLLPMSEPCTPCTPEPTFLRRPQFAA